MSLSDQIMADMKSAMKNHDKTTLNTVRMIKSALMNEKIKAGHDLTPDEELTVLNREKKETIDEVGAKGKSDFGKVMKALMPKIKGRADGKAASQSVRDQLN